MQYKYHKKITKSGDVIAAGQLQSFAPGLI